MPFLRYTCILGVGLAFCFCNPKADKVEETTISQSTLDSLMAVSRTSIFSSAGFDNARILYAYARKANNDVYIGHAYKYMVLTALNTGQRDSIDYYAEQAFNYYEKGDQKEDKNSRILGLKTTLIEWEMQYGSPQLALEKATQLLENAKDNKYDEFLVYKLISNIYNMMGKFEQAETAFLRMLELRKKYHFQEDNSMPFVFLKGAEIAKALRKYDQSLAYCDSSEVYIQRYHNDNTNQNQALLILLNLNRKDNYLDLSRMTDAKKTLDTLDMLIGKDQSNPYYPYIHAAWARYYRHEGEYNTALRYLDPVMTKFKETSNINGYISTQEEKIIILEAMEDYKAAYQLKMEKDALKDSLEISDVHRQLNELQTVYEVDKLKNKAEQDALEIRNTRNVVIFLALASLLFLVVIFVMARSSIILKRKNKKLFSQYKEQDMQQQKIKNITLSTEKSEDTSLSLFERAELYLNQSEAYLDPSLSRESLALELGTNRQYLTQAIQENKNLTFTEYINEYKLNYSRHLLSHDFILPIDEVYIKSGFNNKSTFYRLFRQKYDLTPKEFRKIAMDDKS